MNKSYLFLLISLFLVLGCGEKNLSPDPEEEPQEEQPRENRVLLHRFRSDSQYL